MDSLTGKDTAKLLKAIQDIHTLRDFDTFRRDTLAILTEIFAADSSLSMTSHPDFNNLTAQSLDPDFDTAVQNMLPLLMKYGDQSPLYPLFAQGLLPLTGVYKNSDAIEFKEFQKREIFTDLMKPLGMEDVTMLIIVDVEEARLAKKNDVVLQYAFYHQWDKLNDRIRLMLTLLRPHLLQSYRTVCQYQLFQDQINSFVHDLDRTSVIFLDSIGRVESMTAQAAMLLQAYVPGYHNFRRLPELLESWFRHQIARSKSSDNLHSPQLPLRIQQHNRQLIIRLAIDIPNERYILMLAEEEILSPLAALELLGLTQREAEILAGVIRGKSNQEIANELPITISTVRKNLEHIYEKLGVHSRTEAISVALDRLGCFNVSSFF